MNVLASKTKLVTNYLRIISTFQVGLMTGYLLRLRIKVRRPNLSVINW